MKWMLPLIALSVLTSSCTTKPYMVGSVNEQFYHRHHIPGWHLFRRQYDYSWQERLGNTARVPILYRENVIKRPLPPAPVMEPVYAPTTSTK